MIKRWMYVTLFPALITAYTNPIDCDFEKDICSWSLEGFRRILYNQTNSTGGWNDDMHRNGKEWYLYFDATDESYATLKSKPTTINGLQCLNFWYRFSGREVPQIQVIVQDIGGGNDSVIWETSRVLHTGWRLATVEIDVHYSSMVTILIRGKTRRSDNKIEIDDIVLKLASCLDCNFLDGLCSWNGNRWRVPKEFSYAVMECKYTMNQSEITSNVEIYPGRKCLSFMYQTKDFQRENIYIYVLSYQKRQWSTVWESGWQQQFQGWMEIRLDINLRNKSRINIRFTHENCSNATYYISSISLMKLSCSEATTTMKYNPFIVATSRTTPMPTIATPYSDSMTTKAATTANNNYVDVVNDTSVITASSETITSVTPNHFNEVYIIFATVIGCLAVIVAVLLVSVCYYRRRYLSFKPNTPMTNTGLYEAHVRVSSPENHDQIISLSSGRGNNMSDGLYCTSR